MVEMGTCCFGVWVEVVVAVRMKAPVGGVSKGMEILGGWSDLRLRMVAVHRWRWTAILQAASARSGRPRVRKLRLCVM